MKAMLSFVTAVLTLGSAAQTLPNTSFENWNTGVANYFIADSVPSHWWSEWCNTTHLSTDASDGNYAAVVQGYMACGIAPGVLVNGQHPASGQYIDAGTPFTTKPPVISGYYKLLDAAAGDSAEVTIILKKYNSLLHRPDTVAFGTLALAPSATYAMYSVFLDDRMPNVQPDSIVFVFNSSKHNLVDFQTWLLPRLFVDQIKLAEAVTGIASPAAGADVRLYPNPAADHLTLRLGDNMAAQGEILVAVLATSGQLVATFEPSGNNTFELNRGVLAAGTYFYRVLQGETVLATGPFVLR